MKEDIRYFDVHGHVNFPEYDADREEVIRNCIAGGVGMMAVGTDMQSAAKAVEIAANHDHVFASVGMHPISDHRENASDLKELASHEKVLAIGECGLDLFHDNEANLPSQEQIFFDHIMLANEVNKPLMLHIRNGKNTTNAYEIAVNMLVKNAKVSANFHFFAGTLADLKAILDIGASVSFTGVITFTSDYDGLIRYAPISRIMSETDCPFVSPAPYRGKRNEPGRVVEVVRAVARIRGEDEESVRFELLRNASNFFGKI